MCHLVLLKKLDDDDDDDVLNPRVVASVLLNCVLISMTVLLCMTMCAFVVFHQVVM